MARALIILSILLCVGAPLSAAEPPKSGGEKPDAAAAKLKAQIDKLIQELGDNEYPTREAAMGKLLRIGRPALAALEAAAKDTDLERVWRAKELVAKVSRLPDPAKVDRNCTNGYMPVWGTLKQMETFTADANLTMDALRFRAARTLLVPNPLDVALYAGAKPEGEPLATASFAYEWTDANNKTHGVSRFMQWVDAPMKARLEKGKTYCLVFSSAGSTDTNPWLINCFYRDTFAGGKHQCQDGTRIEELGKYDLVFELKAGEKTLATSVPEKVEFPKQEEYGIGHDGVDLRKVQEAADKAQTSIEMQIAPF